MLTRLILMLVQALAAIVLSVGATLAQPWPSKPIRLVVGYTPGGGNDLIARIVAARLQEKLGQPVLVDNKPGAQSIVAAELVARAAPDGYTLLVAPSGPLSINPAVFARLPYAPERDFAPNSPTTRRTPRPSSLPPSCSTSARNLSSSTFPFAAAAMPCRPSPPARS
jgi:tripartite-type tricarboxylate transporter receptor subunit TctC